jgi:hypothetical protein
MTPCIVGKLENIRQHPNAANLQIAEIHGHQVVVGKHYEEGQMGFFIPDGAIVPDKLLSEMWLYDFEKGRGKLSGKRGNRVKAREMHGVISEGLFYGAYYFENGKRIESPSWRDSWKNKDDVSTDVGVW